MILLSIGACKAEQQIPFLSGSLIDENGSSLAMPNPYPPPEPKNRDLQWWLLLIVAALLVLAVAQFSSPGPSPAILGPDMPPRLPM